MVGRVRCGARQGQHFCEAPPGHSTHHHCPCEREDSKWLAKPLVVTVKGHTISMEAGTLAIRAVEAWNLFKTNAENNQGTDVSFHANDGTTQRFIASPMESSLFASQLMDRMAEHGIPLG